MVTFFEQIKNTYKDKKVFITGHTGFKGAWLLQMLSMAGATIKGFSLQPQYEDDLYNLIEGDTLCLSVTGNLSDKKSVESAILDFEPDFIFHLAAQPLVRVSYDHPSETFLINAVGTAHVLDAVRLLKNRCNVILITTDKVYHNNEWAYPYRENDRLGGYDPYSASKACAEIVINSYRNSFFNINDHNYHRKALAVARAGNVIGGGDWNEARLLPDVMKAMAENRKVIIRNPHAVRPWQHILEPLSAYLMLGMKLDTEPLTFSCAYNFGPYITDTLSVQDMVKLAIEQWGTGNYDIKKEQNQPHEANLLKLDISKAVSELGWTPKYTAVIAVQKTVEWYKAFYYNRNEVNDILQKQILEFIEA